MNLKTISLLLFLFTIDTISTLWLNANVTNGFEANPIMAVVVDSPILFIIAKIIFSIVIIWALWRLNTQSPKAYKWTVGGTCIFYGIVCINNLAGVIYLW